jgi:ATP synthase mitochondrial F1 complex assembly factor 2
MTTKSVLLSTRLVMEYLQPDKCEGRYGVEGISHLASLEVRFQTQMWGEVEDSNIPMKIGLIVAHDVDYADIRRQLGSATTLLHR